MQKPPLSKKSRHGAPENTGKRPLPHFFARETHRTPCGHSRPVSAMVLFRGGKSPGKDGGGTPNE